MKRTKWTLSSAVVWLREEVAAYRVDVAYSNTYYTAHAECVQARIDPETLAITGFMIVPKPAAECVEEFVWQAPWGECQAKGTRVADLVWSVKPPLAVKDGEDSAALERQFQELMNQYVETPWFDPDQAECPESADDVPCGGVWCALVDLGDEVSFYRHSDDHDCLLYAARDANERKKLLARYPNAQEIEVDEAAEFVSSNYSDCFDWMGYDNPIVPNCTNKTTAP